MLIALDSALHEPLYLQIRDQIRQRIVSGALKPGDRLDPSRELAKQLGVHRTTVGNAYAELESEGLIQGTVGRGTFVSTFAAQLKKPPARATHANHDFFWDRFFAGEQPDDSLGRLVASAFEPGVISFAVTHGSEDPSPVEFVRRAVDAVLRRDGAKLLQYGSSEGYAPLRQYLQNRLRRDGIPVELGEILITNGCQQSFDLLRRALVAPGEAVACENPTYPGLWNTFEASGARLLGVPVGGEGIDLDYLAAVLERNRVKLILVSPNFQNPTGRTMPLGARKRLLELAAEHQTPVAEDDIYGALRYRGRELPPLKSLDSAGLVIHFNSFSKVGFPGLRVGWVVAAPRVIERLRWAKQRADLHTNLLGQAVLEELGRRGWLDKVVRATRRLYEQKLDLTRAAIARHFPSEVQVQDPEGGMSLWVELPAGLDSMELLVKARDRGVIFAPARYFYFQEARHNAFRLGFAPLTPEQIEKGVRVLGELLQSEVRRNGAAGKRPARGMGVALV